MFKKCLFLVAILAISLAFSSLLVNTKEKDETREVEDEIKEEVKYIVCTEWIGVYSSLEELVSDTEVIVVGEVISTESYRRWQQGCHGLKDHWKNHQDAPQYHGSQRR